ncbi:MAG: hypothetical protein RQ722_12530 [Desulfuromonadales bacterium]|nr:hypothetical protein [Desulfuromonadales bacterium]
MTLSNRITETIRDLFVSEDISAITSLEVVMSGLLHMDAIKDYFGEDFWNWKRPRD